MLAALLAAPALVKVLGSLLLVVVLQALTKRLGAAALVATALVVAGSLTGSAPPPVEAPDPVAAGAPPPPGVRPASSGVRAPVEPARASGPPASPAAGVPPWPVVRTDEATLVPPPAFSGVATFTPGADGAPVVRIRLEGLPPGAVARVGEWGVDVDGSAIVPRSDRLLEVRVDVPGGGYQPFGGAVRGPRDGRRGDRGEPRTLEGSSGGVFVLTYD